MSCKSGDIEENLRPSASICGKEFIFLRASAVKICLVPDPRSSALIRGKESFPPKR
jgi:hypothetical protein